MRIDVAVKEFARAGVLAMPVTKPDAAPDAPWYQKYDGIVDVVGLVFFVIDHLATVHEPNRWEVKERMKKEKRMKDR